MTTRAKTFAPTNALRMWTDGRNILVELGDHITKYPLTEGGLGRALQLLKERHYDFSGVLAFPPAATLSDSICEGIMRRKGII